MIAPVSFLDRHVLIFFILYVIALYAEPEGTYKDENTFMELTMTGLIVSLYFKQNKSVAVLNSYNLMPTHSRISPCTLYLSGNNCSQRLIILSYNFEKKKKVSEIQNTLCGPFTASGLIYFFEVSLLVVMNDGYGTFHEFTTTICRKQ